MRSRHEVPQKVSDKAIADLVRPLLEKWFNERTDSDWWNRMTYRGNIIPQEALLVMEDLYKLCYWTPEFRALVEGRSYVEGQK